jgi:hypothetical protein
VARNLETARRARHEIERVRLLLIQPVPQVLEVCARHAQVAAQCMGALEMALRGQSNLAARDALNRELIGLRRELRRVSALLDNAARFYSSWALLIGHGPGGLESYRPDGSAAATSVVRKLVVHG